MRLPISLLLALSTSQHQSPPPHKHGLYLGWVHGHNAGDDVLFDVAASMLSEAAHPRAVITLTPHLPAGDCLAYSVFLEAYDFVVLGGGTILPDPRYKCALDRARRVGLPIFVFGSGWTPPAGHLQRCRIDSAFQMLRKLDPPTIKSILQSDPHTAADAALLSAHGAHRTTRGRDIDAILAANATLGALSRGRVYGGVRGPLTSWAVDLFNTRALAEATVCFA